MGVMVESNIIEGRQDIPKEGPAKLKYPFLFCLLNKIYKASSSWKIGIWCAKFREKPSLLALSYEMWNGFYETHRSTRKSYSKNNFLQTVVRFKQIPLEGTHFPFFLLVFLWQDKIWAKYNGCMYLYRRYRHSARHSCWRSSREEKARKGKRRVTFLFLFLFIFGCFCVLYYNYPYGYCTE